MKNRKTKGSGIYRGVHIYNPVLFFFLFVFLVSLTFAREIKNYSHSFFGVYGKKASVMGKVDGSAFETWIYPYKVLHDFRFNVIVNGAEENPYDRIGHFTFSPVYFEREFIGEKWRISQQVYAAYDRPCVFLVFRITALESISIEFSFKPDLSPMWPASIGGKFSYWDKAGFFVLSEATGISRAFFGGFPGKKMGDLPAHKLPGGKLRYRVDLKKGYHEIPLTAYAGRGKYEEIKKEFTAYRDQFTSLLQEREEVLNRFKRDHLRIKTPVLLINEALQWAMLNLNFSFVDNPDLGEGLIAGYGLSGEGERPGFGWYFGGDGLINSFALLNYGDFNGAKKELEFLLKYQGKDGKIMHELSQGAAFVNWFEDYGFPFFHGDTTLYFISFLDFYVRRTGDTAFLYRHRKKIDRLYDWIKNCDGDRDGIVETRLAGTGASETGPLRQKMKTDIYLASLSIKSWEALTHIYTLLNENTRVSLARKRLERSRKALDEMFWDKEKGFYSYAVKENGSQVKETTIWPAIGMRFKVMEKEKGRQAVRKIASPELSTDWGTRFLSSRSKFYDPSSYNNGAVWPFLTGFTSLALYNYENPYHAFSLLLANLELVLNFDYGAATELLSGDIYRPLDQSVPNQAWSSGNTVSAFVEGLLGFEVDAVVREIKLRPAIPLTWDNLQVDNLKAGGGKIALSLRRERDLLIYDFDFSNLKGYLFYFDPRIPAVEKSVKIKGNQVETRLPVKIAVEREKLTVEIGISRYVYPFIKRNLKYGDFSCHPIIENFQLKKSGEFVLDVYGKGDAKIYFCSDGHILCREGTSLREGNITTLTLRFKENWERKSLTGKTSIKQ
jgi:glycogen debranching enzyme